MVLRRLGQKELADTMDRRQIKTLQQHIELVPEDARARILLATRYARLGGEDEAVQQLHVAVELRPKDAVTHYNAACAYALLEKKAEALAALKKAKEFGYSNWAWAAQDTDLVCLHGDLEFERLLEEGKQKG